MRTMRILVLDIGLFPDHETVSAALATTEGHDIATMPVSDREMPEADWDAIAAAILAADRIITL